MFNLNTWIQPCSSQYNEGNETISIETGKEEIKLYLFTDDMTLYQKILRSTILQVLELINDLSNITGYKFNIQILTVFLYSSNDQSENKI